MNKNSLLHIPARDMSAYGRSLGYPLYQSGTGLFSHFKNKEEVETPTEAIW